MIESIRFKNYLCFRGEHELKLDAKVYGITAHRPEDAESSNAGGKSALVESIPLALYGWHRWPTEDHLITRGEAAFEVEIAFAGGHRVMRSRLRGKRTVARYWAPGKGEPSQNDEADAAIAELVGLSFEDFRNSCFFRQKDLSRFVTEEPGKRQKTIGAWFRLEQIESCENVARGMGMADEQELKLLDAAILIADERSRAILADGARTSESFEEAAHVGKTLEEEAAKVVEQLRQELVSIATIQASTRTVEAAKQQYDAVCDEGRALRDKVVASASDEIFVELRHSYETASAVEVGANAAFQNATRLDNEKRRLSVVGFDGRCPVSARTCPVATEINADRDSARKVADEAATSLWHARREWEEAGKAKRTALNLLDEAERIRQQLANLRTRAGDLKKLAESAPPAASYRDPEFVVAELNKVQQTMLEARANVERARGFSAELKRLSEERERAIAKKLEIESRLGVVREGVAIFKAAQRRVAESTLGQFEDEANAVLAESRVLGFDGPLTMNVRWARETGSPAKSCASCGAPFPTSAKVKACSRCGADRGRHQENKLDVILSDQSGALDDWAGCLFQLAAARWLRADRGSLWDTLMIDEPFGALDPRNRKALARHFAKTLPEFAAQSFIIAHSPDVTNALAGRIEIDATPLGSIPRVVA